MHTFGELRGVVAKLRSEKGCPWDKEQTFESLKKCLADKTKEVLETVGNKDMEDLYEELRGVLLQVVLNSEIASEQGNFTIDDVIGRICRKVVRRHPHVFGSVKIDSVEEGTAF